MTPPPQASRGRQAAVSRRFVNVRRLEHGTGQGSLIPSGQSSVLLDVPRVFRSCLALVQSSISVLSGELPNNTIRSGLLTIRGTLRRGLTYEAVVLVS